jgi:hypothetical protein
MKTTVLVGITISMMTVVGMAWARANSQKPADAAAPETSKPGGFYCDRLALTADQRARNAELEKTLRSSMTAVHELSDGYEFEFPPDSHLLQALTEWISLERLCCRFFDFNLRVRPEAGPFSVSLRGKEGVKEFIRLDFDPHWFGK